ncbi:ArpU family phage packaging/lysis transcriptional regulator [Paenibacillus agilis]|uniref:Transcriptional regulator n=1 Tax=Paenibacillus agilis TaxID=3020863 RepID=A0A559IL18_9BACL|nr:ArpU family phage packaging/lysis transcriptional regulator [Paenibacillus agilis]TVX88356.1 transcriptional regulator [Paenibacillus agilis]
MLCDVSFDLPDLDKEATRRNVEAVLEKYRMYKQIGYEVKETRLTSTYTVRSHGPTNRVTDQTGDIAADNVDIPEKMRTYCERVEKAAQRLPEKERQIITERYLKEDGVYDYQVYSFTFDPPLSEYSYYKLKWKAISKLAISLNVQVFVDTPS